MTPAPTASLLRPPALHVLEQAVAERRSVRARYHDHERLLCPHALGCKNGRILALVYQCRGTTSGGALPRNPQQRWRSMFIDELEDVCVTDDPWQTADNYSSDVLIFDTLILAVDGA